MEIPEARKKSPPPQWVGKVEDLAARELLFSAKIGVTATVVLLTALVLVGTYSPWFEKEKAPILAAFITVLAIAMATAGWLTQRHTQRGLARKQHTLNVLLGMKTNELFNTHRVNIRSKFGHPLTPLTPQQVDEFNTIYEDPKSYEVLKSSGRAVYPPEDSVIYYLNYLEAIAVSISNSDLDEEMVRIPLESTFTTSVMRYWPILIKDLKIKEFTGQPSDPLQTYIELYKLALRWGLTLDDVKDFYKDHPHLITRP